MILNQKYKNFVGDKVSTPAQLADWILTDAIKLMYNYFKEDETFQWEKLYPCEREEVLKALHLKMKRIEKIIGEVNGR